MNTTNCVVCGQHGKRVRATHWHGYVLLLDDEKREKVTAGFCRRHKDVELPHKNHISRSTHCVGMWMPDYGRHKLIVHKLVTTGKRKREATKLK